MVNRFQCISMRFLQAVIFIQDKIESSTEILEAILNPMVEESGDIIWPPRDQESLVMMVKV